MKKYGKTPISHTVTPLLKTYTTDYYTTQQKQIGNNPNCEYCGFTEDNLYLFIQSTRMKNIWKHYQTILARLTGQKYTPQQHLFLNTPNTNKNTVNKINNNNNTNHLLRNLAI